jgi:hypothetical protein
MASFLSSLFFHPAHASRHGGALPIARAGAAITPLAVEPKIPVVAAPSAHRSPIRARSVFVFPMF